MSDKVKVLIIVVLLLASFAGGRWLAPEKVRVETKTVEVEKKIDKIDKTTDKHKEAVIVEVVKPDGTKETTTKTVEDVKVKIDTKEVVLDTVTTDKTKEVAGSSAKVTIAAMGGLTRDFSPVYGAAVSKPILGPVTVGAWGLSNLTFGASVGLTF